MYSLIHYHIDININETISLINDAFLQTIVYHI